MIKLPPDWTFIAQIVAFVVFWQLMRWAVFGPTQGVLAARATACRGRASRGQHRRQGPRAGRMSRASLPAGVALSTLALAFATPLVAAAAEEEAHHGAHVASIGDLVFPAINFTIFAVILV